MSDKKDYVKVTTCDDYLNFVVSSISDIEDLDYGHFNVYQDGTIESELDRYLLVYHPDMKSEALNALKENGLDYILSGKTEEVLKSLETIECYQSFDKDPQIWERAKEYVNLNKSKVGSFEVTEGYTEEFETHRKR